MENEEDEDSMSPGICELAFKFGTELVKVSPNLFEIKINEKNEKSEENLISLKKDLPQIAASA